MQRCRPCTGSGWSPCSRISDARCGFACDLPVGHSRLQQLLLWEPVQDSSHAVLGSLHFACRNRQPEPSGDLQCTMLEPVYPLVQHVNELWCGHRPNCCMQDFSDLVAQKASQQKRKAEQAKSAQATKKQKEFKF